MQIGITGTPGSGKTTIARLLAKKLTYELIECTSFVNKHALGKRANGEIEVAIPPLRDALVKELKRHHNVIVEGHLICEMALPLDMVFVIRCAPKKLLARLMKRKYREEKINENMECELLDYCTIKSEKNYLNVRELSTEKRGVNASVHLLVRAVKDKKKKLDTVDYSNDILPWLLTVNKHGTRRKKIY